VNTKPSKAIKKSPRVYCSQFVHIGEESIIRLLLKTDGQTDYRLEAVNTKPSKAIKKSPRVYCSQFVHIGEESIT
jgi:hypothetical protein